MSNIQEASYSSTLLSSELSGGCFRSSRLVWDPSVIFNFSLVQFVECQSMITLLEDKQSLGREHCNAPIFGFPYSAVGDDLWGLCQAGQKSELCYQ